MTDKWTDRLSEYLDNELTEAETEALEAHLLECADCGRSLEQLRAVVARAQQIIDRPPVNDLWQGIADRIEQPVVDVAPQHRAHRVAFSIPQLIAASIVLVLLSAGTMYMYVKKDVQLIATAPNQQAIETDEAQPYNIKPVAAKTYENAIGELERALNQGRSQLDTTTVKVLEKNLRTIDVAINEAKAALSNDPKNAYLNRYLDETMQKKIQLLRRATGILRAET
jgi:hypothetical protein